MTTNPVWFESNGVQILEEPKEHRYPYTVIFADGHHEDANGSTLADVMKKPGALCRVKKDYYALRQWLATKEAP